MSRGILPRVNFWWILVSSTLLVNVSRVKAHSCHEVKTAFQLRHIGPLNWVPETPGTDDAKLQICQHSGPTCCTRKMEESYKAAVQRETLQNIAAYSYEVKYLLTSHATAFQDTLQSVVSFSKSHVSSLFDSSYPDLAPDAGAPVSELFADLSLFICGGNTTVESAVHRFYDSLFPAVYKQLLNPRAAGLTSERDDCLRMTRQDVNPFGPHPGELAQELARALQAGRALSRALAAGEEVMNVVEHGALTRECGRALVRMQYCSHCRGLTLIKPCVGYCLNVMRGCLAGLAELDRPWRRYFAVLQDVGDSMAGAHDLELALLGVRSQIGEALEYSLLHGPRLVATVDKVCGQPTGTDMTVSPTPETATSPPITVASSLPPTQAQVGQLAHLRSSLPLKSSKKDEPEGLKKISRELMRYMQNYKTFFSVLPDVLCEGEMVVDDFTCWSGDDVVETLSYSTRVVDIGLQAQRHNPEVKVRSPDASLTEVKEMLERFNQRHQLGRKRRKRS
ncbi:glypican-5-like isoform X3 [Conger conger]|uniref:glypican-5-like isoform X3 n=1 Tax=Conger conger TaxID=82655 RepID=UPI002A5B0F4D|nr:glypican-5-like isoform X3 [Conger conger]